MEPYIADFLTNKNVPKILRYIVLLAIIAFIEFIFINVVINIIAGMIWFGWRSL